MGILSSLINKYVAETVTAVNVSTVVDNAMNNLAAWVAGTPNRIDDAILAEVQENVDFDYYIPKFTSWFRGLIGINSSGFSTPKGPGLPLEGMYSAPIGGFSASHPRFFLTLIRGRLVTEGAAKLRANGVGAYEARQKARAAVNKLTDETILEAADQMRIPRGAIGDGTIFNWILSHLPEMLALVMKLLPLLMLI